MEKIAWLDLVISHVLEAQGRYPGLALVKDGDDLTVAGPVSFTVGTEDKAISDSYQVSIKLLRCYPNEPPVSYDQSGRIPASYHTNPDNDLCLEVPMEIRRRFAANRTLLSYIEKLLIPFLYGFSFFALHGIAPYGERPHGTEGLLDFYTEFFSCPPRKTLLLLDLLANGPASPDFLCACGSQRTLRGCHGEKVLELSKCAPARAFKRDAREIRRFLTKK